MVLLSLEWPLSARRRCYRIGCKRSRGGPLTQTQSQTESYKPQPTSKNQSQSRYSLLLRNYSLLLLTSSTPRSKFAQYSSFKSAMSIRRAQIIGFRPTPAASPYRADLLVRRTYENRELKKRRPSPLPPPHPAQRRNTRKDEESIARTQPTVA